MAHSVSELIGDLGKELSREARTCEKHGEYSSALIGSGKSRPAIWTGCFTCIQEDNAKRQEEEAEERVKEYARSALEKKIGRACIPPRFSSRRFDDYRAETEGQKRALRICKAYADSFEENLKLGRSILMLGNVGTGKTHLAASVGNQILLETKHSVLYATASQVIRHVKNSFDRDADHTESDAYAAFGKPQLLILDEVGVQNATEFELTVMFEVINWRYEEMLPTMVISNRSIEDLPRFLGDRVVDRLRENGGKLVLFDWKSERSNIKGNGDE